MAQVIRTKKGTDADWQIVGIGVLSADGKGGVAVDAAAASGMSELVEKNDDGSLKLDENGATIPLSGSKLTAAAKAFAEKYPELEVVSVGEEKIAKLAEDAGNLPELPPAGLTAEYEYQRIYGTTVPVEIDGETVAEAAIPEPPLEQEEDK